MEDPATSVEVSGSAQAFSNASLAPVWQLNAYFLDTLTRCLQHPAWRGSSWGMVLGPNLADVLPSVRDELSRTPVSLVDVGLSDEGSRFPLAGVTGGPACSPPPFLARERASQLAQVTITLAWTLARSDAIATSIVFGISRSRAKEIRAIGFHSIAGISEKLAGAVRPRWLNEPRIWQRLFESSERPSGARLAPRRIWILQRQFADLLPATSAMHLFDNSRP